MKNEPVVTVAAIAAVVGAAISLLVAFGIDVSKEQTAAILGFVTVAGPLVAAFIQRQRVTPVGKHTDGMPLTNPH